MKVVFVGTDDIADLCLKSVHGSRHEIVLVISQPDRPSGRGRKIKPGIVHGTADELALPLLQPESIRTPETVEAIKNCEPDVMAVVSYGEYIPSFVYTIPKHNAINVHPSLLPRWRGAAPVRWTLIEGDTETGVTVQYLAKRMDAGDVLHRRTVEVLSWYDHGKLCEILYPLGAELLVETLDGLEDGTITPEAQDESLVTKAPKIQKQDLWIDFRQPAEKVINRVRALAPKPGGRVIYREDNYKILYCEPELRDLDGTHEPGTIVEVDRNGPIVACSDKGLLLTRIQPPGKKPYDGNVFVNGYRPETGEKFSIIEP